MKHIQHTWVEDKEGGLVAARLNVWQEEGQRCLAEGIIFHDDGEETEIRVTGCCAEWLAVQAIEDALFDWTSEFKRTTDKRDVY